jgi:hypothetical protein
MNRRQFTGHLVLAGTGLVLAGCPTSSDVLAALEAWVPVGLAAFDGVAAMVDTTFTVIATTVDALWAAVQNAISLYEHSTDPKNTRLDVVIVALDALAGGLTQALAALPISIPAAVLNAARLAIALTIATLKAIRDKLQPITAPMAIYSGAVNTLPASSTKDFINKFNSIMEQNGQATRVH